MVIGAGIAGMIAATCAAEGGQRVLVLERSADDRYLCNTRMTAGIFHCALTSVTTDPAVLEKKILAITDAHADAELVHAVSHHAWRAVRWLQQHGSRFIRGAQSHYDHTLAPPTVDPQQQGWMGRGGDVLLRDLEGHLRNGGGKVLRGHRAGTLLMHEGRCIGVAGEDVAANTFRIEAAHVVLADGGFQSDPLALLGHISPAPEKVFQRNARSGLGDGLRMAREAGVALSDLRGFYGHLLSADAFTNDRLWPHLWLDYVAAAGLLCDRSGRRFCDEGMGGVSMANQVAALADPLGACVVMDSTIWREVGAANIQAPNPRLREKGGTVFEAASLRELARLAKINETGLVAQVDEHNAALANGALATLSPPRTTGAGAVWPIVKPPFVAIPVCAGITYTMGGVRIDGQSRALDRAGSPIAGLYAAGSTTGGLEGGPQVGYVGGLIKASVTALRAAETILGITAENR